MAFHHRLYDPKKEDPTQRKMRFSEFIRKAARNMEIYLNYKRDRRQTMGDCLTKGEEYEKKQKEDRDLFLLKMKYFTFGEEVLTKKEIRLLKRLKVIKPVRRFGTSQYFKPEELESSDDEADTKQSLMKKHTL